MKKRRVIAAALMAAKASAALLAPLALGNGAKGTMLKWMRGAAVAAVLSLGLFAQVLAGMSPAVAGVSLGDACGD